MIWIVRIKNKIRNWIALSRNSLKQQQFFWNCCNKKTTMEIRNNWKNRKHPFILDWINWLIDPQPKEGMSPSISQPEWAQDHWAKMAHSVYAQSNVSPWIRGSVLRETTNMLISPKIVKSPVYSKYINLDSYLNSTKNQYTRVTTNRNKLKKSFEFNKMTNFSLGNWLINFVFKIQFNIANFTSSKHYNDSSLSVSNLKFFTNYEHKSWHCFLTF